MTDGIEIIVPEACNYNYLKLKEDTDFDHLLTETINYNCLEFYLEAISNLRVVAEKVGVEDTRKHLIPHVTNLIITEKLLELKDLAVILGDFEHYVGGPKFVHILLLPLEELAGAKLTDVRLAAIKSLQTLAGVMESSDLETYFIPVISNMTVNSRYAKRWSVCNLLTTVYMRVSSKHQDNLINYHCLLSFDSILSVRQNAVKHLVNLNEVVHLSIFDNKLISHLEQLSCDQNETVRMLALLAAISISKKNDVSYVKKIILPIVISFVNDPSWEVRLILIKNITMLLNIDVSCLKFTKNIIKILTVLSEDQQLEVRLQSVNILYDCALVLYKSLPYLEANKLVVKFLIPTLCNLSHDSNVNCKLELSTILSKFGKILPIEYIQVYFIDLVKKLLNDENIDVVFNIIKYIKDILGPQYHNCVAIPEDLLICYLKAFIINDSWEIRNKGAIYLGILAVQMGLKFFEDNLEQSFLILLTDEKPVIQETAIDVFKLLVKEFGMNWAQTYIVPYLIKLSYSKSTYNKMTFLSLAKVCVTMMCVQFRVLKI